jgi:hypothetical protein
MEATGPEAGAERIREIEGVLTRRVAALERELERVRRRSTTLQLGAGAALAISCLALAATLFGRGAGASADTLTTRRIEIRDADTVRAIVGMSADGAPGLFLKDRRGTTRLRVELRPDGTPGITLWNAQGEHRLVELAALPESAHLLLADASGKSAAALRSSPDGTGRLVVTEPEVRAVVAPAPLAAAAAPQAAADSAGAVVP